MASLGQQVLERVVSKLGGPEQAARQLGISLSLMQRFLDRTLQVPDSILLKAVDYVLSSAPVEPPPAVLPESPKPRGPIVI